jgi:hypothetical protein
MTTCTASTPEWLAGLLQHPLWSQYETESYFAGVPPRTARELIREKKPPTYGTPSAFAPASSKAFVATLNRTQRA